MSRSSRPAEQLSLQLSVEASVTLANEAASWEAYARELEAKLDSATQTQAKLEARVEALKKDNARLSDAAHPLHDECKQLRQEVDSLRSKLYQRVWQELEGLRRPDRLGTGPSKADLTRLLKIAHPDRWQHQPAETLAHELAVAINQMRAGATA